MEDEESNYTSPAPEPTLWEKIYDLRKGVSPKVFLWLIGISAMLGFVAGQLSK